MAVQSLDLLKVGDWIVCEAGAKILIRSPFSEDLIEKRDKEMEGVLAKVLAINPPVFLLDIYMLEKERKFPLTINFHDALWSKANDNYRRQYLKVRKIKKKKPVSDTQFKGELLP